MVRGSHPALRYRGNALKRHKIWFQKEGSHFYVYKYTGWQKRADGDVSTGPSKASMFVPAGRRSGDNDASEPLDLYVVRRWKRLHRHALRQDAYVDPGSSFLVQKWGHPRRFVIALQDHADVDKCTVIFDKILPSGTKVLVDSDANVRTRHGVPPMEGDIGPSGSIVGRHIAEKISFDAADKMVQQAIQDRRKRQLKKTEANGRKKARKETL